MNAAGGIQTMSRKAFARFDHLCKLVAGQGKGLSMVQVRDCRTLALALGEEHPDRHTVDDLCRRLRLDVEDVLPRERAP